MRRAAAIFDASIVEARNLTALYLYLSETVKAPHVFDDLLRSQVIYSVSAFDKLIHDLIRIGMVACYMGTRAATDRYNAEPITLHFHSTLVAATLVAATIPPKEHLFEQEIVRKHGHLSFQDPTKLAEGLSLIWSENHKWNAIASAMGWTTDKARIKLKLIADRRNAIVHESDMHPLTNVKTPITVAECNDVTDFVQLCGQTIVSLVS